VPRPNAYNDAHDLLSNSLALARTQLLGQLADETSLDGRTAGTLGFNGALLAAAIAARGVLGAYWWTPLLTVGMATLYCLRPALAIDQAFARNSDLGPLADEFYHAYIGQSSTLASEQMLNDLDKAFANNARRLEAKRRALRAALLTLAFGLSAATLLIGLG
jgi:hypothetical protein